MAVIMEIVSGIRNIRGEMRIPPAKKVNVVVDAPEETLVQPVKDNLGYVRSLAKVEDVTFALGADKPQGSATAVCGAIQVHVLLAGLLDFEEEKKRLRKEIKKVEKDVEMGRRKLQNENFLQKAPAEIVGEVKEKVEALSQRLERLKKNLEFFEGING
jgi:valyl-tRNA synthetase